MDRHNIDLLTTKEIRTELNLKYQRMNLEDELKEIG